MSKKILQYLQENSWNLSKKFPNLVDARFESKPSRLVLVFEGQLPNIENLKLDFKVETQVINTKIEKKVAGENKNLKAWKQRHKNAGLNEAVSEKLNEISPIPKNSKKITAYEAWKKRHGSVKWKNF